MKTRLAAGPQQPAWAYRSWRQFALMDNAAGHVVILPVCGLSDWGLDVPLDFEEQLTMALLNAAWPLCSRPDEILILPPLRWLPGTSSISYFRVPIATAHSTLESIASSIKAAGFRKCLFLNASPLNTDLLDAAGRDLRISHGLQPFCINLSSIGLGLDDAEARPRLTRILRAILHADGAGADPLREEGEDCLRQSALRLASLVNEVQAFRPLPEDGAIPFAKP